MKSTKLTHAALAITTPTTLLSPLFLSSCTEVRQGDKPNIIFILMDDAGYGDFGCYGQTKTETPNIDALAQSGIRFTNMYTNCPVSAPSRACLMTGQHNGHCQIRDNVNINHADSNTPWWFDTIDNYPEVEAQMGLEPGTPTLATKMKEAGYATAMVGKWGLGAECNDSSPKDMGFDLYYGYICQRMAHNYYPQYLWKNSNKHYINDISIVTHPGTKLDEGADPYDPKSYEKYSKDKVYAPDVMYDNVVDFVRTNRDNPFFLMWTTNLPHSPLMAPQEWVEKYVAKYGDEEPLVGDNLKTHTFPHNYYPCRYPHATYSAMISYFDYQVGELVKELKRLGIYDNTLIIFTSDNGPANNASSPTVWMDSAAPFRCGAGWGKRTLREGGIRMPFIASLPSKMTGGEVSDHIGYFADVMPTICELAGVDAPQTDGISIAPTLLGNNDLQRQHEYLYWEFADKGGQVAVRWGDWKGIVENMHSGNRTMKLFNISTPSKDMEFDQMDVATTHPDIVERLWGYIEQSHTQTSIEKFKIDISR